MLQSRQSRLPDPFRTHPTSRRLVSHQCRRQRQLRGPCHLRYLLDAQLLWHDSFGSCLRERRHDCRPALDGALAHFLGDHQCLNWLLLARLSTAILPVGLRMALTANRVCQPDTSLLHTRPIRTEFWYISSMDRGGNGVISILLLFHALEDNSATEKSDSLRGDDC